VIYAAALMIVIAVALFVAAPLSAGFSRRQREAESELDRLRHDEGLAIQGLRELEFDFQMGKLDETDYRELRQQLEMRALAAMKAIERLGAAPRTPALTLKSRRSKPLAFAATAAATHAAEQRANFCPQCGTRAGAGHNFCAGCGASLNVARTGTQDE
jgi:NADH pyrophosphatase NudC (nudix superfamily)